ncbi:MAG TPA: 2-C-methyl-D-erythritol 2,4-cyclodiphosphate synthase [SAR86 cluster bacterium]|nr:2-C-methyl-D-erythritol 2,4-cyclodiphosphate synthase [SAR86 cluster bacterium]|tara:strand:+ start:8192 stop:8662 length:471 start_codon:yes stop_codon:yes gene_type:complete
MRVGHGYDAHKLVPGSHVILGGIKIDSTLSIEAHSDGDIIIHSLIDSLLGAAAYGDLGTFFPSEDDQYKDISSRELLKRVVKELKKDKYIVSNVDITFIGQLPKLNPYILQIRKNLSEDLGIDTDRISCKATTTDSLGFEGSEEGVSCHAVTLITK